MEAPPCHGGEEGDWGARLTQDQATGQSYVQLVILHEDTALTAATSQVLCWVRADQRIAALSVGTERH